MKVELATLKFSPTLAFMILSFWGHPFPEAGRQSIAQGCEMKARREGDGWLIF